MEQVIEYIHEKYNPLSIILYGSYADGTNNLNSDFDALVIVADHEQFHDTSIVDGVSLDIFVYRWRILTESMSARSLCRSMMDASLRTATGLEKGCKRRFRPIYENVR